MFAHSLREQQVPQTTGEGVVAGYDIVHLETQIASPYDLLLLDGAKGREQSFFSLFVVFPPSNARAVRRLVQGQPQSRVE